MKAREQQYTDHEVRIQMVENAIINIDKRFDILDRRFDQIDKRFDRLELKLERIENRTWTNFYWMLAAFGALLATMAHGFKWI